MRCKGTSSGPSGRPRNVILCGKDTRLGNVLTVDCTGTACQEKVSYAEQEILNTLVKGLHDGETKEEVLTHR